MHRPRAKVCRSAFRQTTTCHWNLGTLASSQSATNRRMEGPKFRVARVATLWFQVGYLPACTPLVLRYTVRLLNVSDQTCLDEDASTDRNTAPQLQEIGTWSIADRGGHRPAMCSSGVPTPHYRMFNRIEPDR